MPSSSKGLNILKVFNYTGAALIFFGIAYFVSVNWYSLNDFVQIFSTLGAAIAAFLIGFLLHLDEKHGEAGAATFLIAGLLFPVGIMVTLTILDVRWSGATVDLFTSGVCFLIFLIGFFCLPRTILLFFTLIFSALFFLCIIDYIIETAGVYPDDLYNYCIMIIGLSAILIGRYLDTPKNFPLTGFLYFMGALLLLTASFFLSDSFLFSGQQRGFRLVSVFYIALALILSVPMRSKSFLYLGALFLVLYLLDMSARFAKIFGTMGWPLMLIMAGFVLIVLGYFIYYVHRKIGATTVRE